MADWKPIDTAPKDGTFLVWLEKPDRSLNSQVAIARWHPNIKIINGHFAFDAEEPLYWRPLPEPPSSASSLRSP